MKVIFLDFDGVLNSQSWYKRRVDEVGLKDVHTNYPNYEIDPETVKRLNFIISETGAKVVVSSTWRLGRTVEDLHNILKFAGFSGEIIDVTSHMRIKDYSVPRGCEIDKWLEDKDFRRVDWSVEKLRAKVEKAQVKNYVILDDDSDMLYNQREHFVQTSWMTGITDDDAKKCVEILNSPLERLYYKDIDWDA